MAASAPNYIMDLRKYICCTTCGKVKMRALELKVCSGCKMAEYCSTECQTIDWKNGHKKQCLKMLEYGGKIKEITSLLIKNGVTLRTFGVVGELTYKRLFIITINTTDNIKNYFTLICGNMLMQYHECHKAFKEFDIKETKLKEKLVNIDNHEEKKVVEEQINKLTNDYQTNIFIDYTKLVIKNKMNIVAKPIEVIKNYIEELNEYDDTSYYIIINLEIDNNHIQTLMKYKYNSHSGIEQDVKIRILSHPIFNLILQY
jgi:hypothetical protein